MAQSGVRGEVLAASMMISPAVASFLQRASSSRLLRIPDLSGTLVVFSAPQFPGGNEASSCTVPKHLQEKRALVGQPFLGTSVNCGVEWSYSEGGLHGKSRDY